MAFINLMNRLAVTDQWRDQPMIRASSSSLESIPHRASETAFSAADMGIRRIIEHFLKGTLVKYLAAVTDIWRLKSHRAYLFLELSAEFIALRTILL